MAWLGPFDGAGAGRGHTTRPPGTRRAGEMWGLSQCAKVGRPQGAPPPSDRTGGGDMASRGAPPPAPRVRAGAVMRVRQFRLVLAAEPDDAAADALFDRADDLCVEFVGAAAGAVPPAFDGLPCGLAPPGPVAWVAYDRVAPTLA